MVTHIENVISLSIQSMHASRNSPSQDESLDQVKLYQVLILCMKLMCAI